MLARGLELELAQALGQPRGETERIAARRTTA